MSNILLKLENTLLKLLLIKYLEWAKLFSFANPKMQIKDGKKVEGSLFSKEWLYIHPFWLWKSLSWMDKLLLFIIGQPNPICKWFNNFPNYLQHHNFIWNCSEPIIYVYTFNYIKRLMIITLYWFLLFNLVFFFFFKFGLFSHNFVIHIFIF